MAKKKKSLRGRPRLQTNRFGRWIDAKGMSREQVADRLGVTRPYIDRLCRGASSPNLTLAVMIEDLTKGTVRPRDWVTKAARTR